VLATALFNYTNMSESLRGHFDNLIISRQIQYLFLRSKELMIELLSEQRILIVVKLFGVRDLVADNLYYMLALFLN
jgi:hypothetical protein